MVAAVAPSVLSVVNRVPGAVLSGSILHSSFMPAIFGAQVFSTFAMLGVIWFVQVVHYPLFAKVGQSGFAGYAAAHANRTTVVVMPLMCLELLSAAALLFAAQRPACISAGESRFGLGLVGMLWASTGLVQVPLHNALQRGFTPDAARRLVHTNWLRTAGWTARALLLIVWLHRILQDSLSRHP